MSPCPRVQAAVFERQKPPLPGRRVRLALLSLLAAVLQGCADLPKAPKAGPDPSNPAARTPAVSYRSTTTPYVSRRPSEPAPWQQRNERVAPPPGSKE